jgi:peptide/nickel transport system substrate-binding protein
MRKFRRFAAVPLAIVLGVLAASCGDSSSPTDSTQAAVGEPQPGGSASIIVPNELPNLDPAQFNNTYAGGATVGNALYGSLFTNDPITGEILPSLGESITTTDSTNWTLTLKPDLTFTDGTPLDAEAVKFNWERLNDRTVSASVNVAAAASIATIDVVDPTTIEFTASSPSAHIGQTVVSSALNFLGSPTALAEGPEAFTENPVGAGPFTLTSWIRQDRMTLAKNPDYFDAPRPYLDELVIRTDPEMSRRLQSIQAGEVDMVLGSSDEYAARAEDNGLVVTRQPLNGANMVIFNMAAPPFDDLRARQAVVAAVDLEVVNQVAYAGFGTVPDTFMVEGTPFYDASLTFPKPDPELAQRLFDELAADGKPVEFKLLTTQATDAIKVAQSFQAQLSAFENVTVELETLDITTWFTRLATGNFGASIFGVITVDPEPSMARLLLSNSPGNYPKINDPELDAALNAGAATDDEAERVAAYRTAQERVIELLPFVPYTRPNPSFISTPAVGGVVLYGQFSPRVDTLWLNQSG